VETEEEIGSPHFAETLRAIGPAAATDAVVVSDTVWVSRGRPSLSAGLRGLQRITFTSNRGDRPALGHDRRRRPQPVPSSPAAGEIFDARTGHVKIPGFYDDVEKLTARQIADFKAAGFSVRGFMKDTASSRSGRRTRWR